mmetsp:Transcript_11297/g.35103  ORF Transcript_11297/g.35103 Transcript_11297/m.35103 type:complete len:324 (+) Transcript_11297:496-1467(+)
MGQGRPPAALRSHRRRAQRAGDAVPGARASRAPAVGHHAGRAPARQRGRARAARVQEPGEAGRGAAAPGVRRLRLQWAGDAPHRGPAHSAPEAQLHRRQALLPRRAAPRVRRQRADDGHGHLGRGQAVAGAAPDREGQVLQAAPDGGGAAGVHRRRAHPRLPRRQVRVQGRLRRHTDRRSDRAAPSRPHARVRRGQPRQGDGHRGLGEGHRGWRQAQLPNLRGAVPLRAAHAVPPRRRRRRLGRRVDRPRQDGRVRRRRRGDGSRRAGAGAGQPALDAAVQDRALPRAQGGGPGEQVRRAAEPVRHVPRGGCAQKVAAVAPCL